MVQCQMAVERESCCSGLVGLLHRRAPRLDSEIKLRERALHLGFVEFFSGLVDMSRSKVVWRGSKVV